MTPASRAEIGARGEELAAGYLSGRGYIIRDRNWRHGHGELDIVAEHGSAPQQGEIVFVEVRVRNSDAYGVAQESVGARKQAKLIETAQAWLQAHDLADAQWQIDVIAIVLDRHNGLKHLDHIECAISQTSKT